MGFSQNADGQNISKQKLSETGDRAGSILSVYGKQTNQMGQSGGRLNLAAVANAMNDGNSGGEAPFRVHFKAAAPLSQPNVPVLQLREVSFRWPGQPSDLLSDVTMTAHMGQRIALLGANGQGKSTLVDVMRGALSPRVGEVILGHGVTFSHYSQHSAATLPPEATPLQYLASLFPDNTEMELRSVLGSYNVRGNLATHARCGGRVEVRDAAPEVNAAVLRDHELALPVHHHFLHRDLSVGLDREGVLVPESPSPSDHMSPTSNGSSSSSMLPPHHVSLVGLAQRARGRASARAGRARR